MIQRTTLFKTTLGLVMLAACSGCSSDDDDDDSGGGQLLIMPLSQDATSNGLTVTTAELSFIDISLEPCVAGTALLDTYNFSVDLLSEPPPGVLFVSAVTDFCGLDVTIGPQTTGAFPELAGASALFEGTRADAVPFTLTSTLGATLDFETDKPLDAMNLVLGVDFNAWFANADVTDADASDSGVLIDANDNPYVLAAFDADASTSIALYDDANGDGRLTDEELVPVATAATP